MGCSRVGPMVAVVWAMGLLAPGVARAEWAVYTSFYQDGAVAGEYTFLSIVNMSDDPNGKHTLSIRYHLANGSCPISAELTLDPGQQKNIVTTTADDCDPARDPLQCQFWKEVPGTQAKDGYLLIVSDRDIGKELLIWHAVVFRGTSVPLEYVTGFTGAKSEVKVLAAPKPPCGSRVRLP